MFEYRLLKLYFNVTTKQKKNNTRFHVNYIL